MRLDRNKMKLNEIELHRLMDPLIDWLTDWMTDWNGLIDWLTDWLTDWLLIDWLDGIESIGTRMELLKRNGMKWDGMERMKWNEQVQKSRLSQDSPPSPRVPTPAPLTLLILLSYHIISYHIVPYHDISHQTKCCLVFLSFCQLFPFFYFLLLVLVLILFLPLSLLGK